MDFLVGQRHLFYIVTRLACAFGELLGQLVTVASLAGARLDNQYILHLFESFYTIVFIELMRAKLAIILDETKNNRCNLQYDDGRDAISKLLVERLVMPHLHGTPCTDASAHSCQYQQRGFRNAPLSLLRFPLVDAVHEERDEVEYEEQNEYYLYHFETFIHSLL
jgi:hypothetical protein